MIPLRSRHVVLSSAVFAALLLAPEARAVGTRSFHLSSMDDFKGGDLTGVSIDSHGSVRAGLTFGSVPIADASSTWATVAVGNDVLVATGSEGKVFKVSGGQAKLVQKTGALAVSSMAAAWGGAVYGGSFPDGKIFAIDPNGTGGDAKAFATLPDAEAVWDLAFDAKNKVLYAATGPNGKLFRIDQNGKAQVYYDSDEPHLMSVAVDGDGNVYAGSNGKGLLYKIAGGGRATVVHDFDADEVKALAFGANGLYVVTNSYSEPFTLPKRNKESPGKPSASRPGRPGKGSLFKLVKDATPEKLLHDSDTHYVSLSIGDDGNPYVGTGAEGRIYTVDANLVSRLVADVEERQVGALAMAGKKPYFVTTDPVVFHEVKGQGGANAVWTSKVLDAGIRAQWGRLSWRAEGALDFETRSGSTLVPDATWSAWQGGLAQPGDAKSPAARYVQIRARFGKDPKAVLNEVTLSFLTDNLRGVVTSIDATSKLNKSGLKTGVASSGGEVGRPSSSVSLSWRVENPDQDELRYRLSYRIDGKKEWFPLTKPTDKVTRTSFDWDTTALPEGVYRVKVEASDELANPAEKVLKHELESGTILVDHTPPVFKTLGLKGRRVSGEVVDGLGPIARIEVAVAGSEEWRPVHPSDGIFDEASETFDADVSAIVPAGAAIVSVRAYDAAGNVVVRSVQ